MIRARVDLAIVGLDASPVSMQFTEAYEALQRNTIDALGGLRIGSVRVPRVAHVTFPEAPRGAASRPRRRAGYQTCPGGSS